jgi:AraC-like DNA-binding protein
MVNPVNGLRTMTLAAFEVTESQSHTPCFAGSPELQPQPFIKRFTTSDPEQARENVQICHPWIRGYVPFTNGQRYRHSRVQITLDRITVTRSIFSHVRLTAENDDRVVLVLAERGWRSLQGRGAPVVSSDGLSAVLMPRGRVIYENGPDSSGFVLSVPISDLAESAEPPFGRHDTQARGIDLSSQVASQFHSALHFVVSQLSDSRVPCTPILAMAYREVLLAGLASLILPPPSRVCESNAGARLVRQACELIRGSLSEPLRLNDVATTLGVSLRQLQVGFRNHLGTTPQKFLRDRRLEKAHRMLSFPSRGETAATIARACGFGHLGEFAARYRELFGERPSDTFSRQRAQFH